MDEFSNIELNSLIKILNYYIIKNRTELLNERKLLYSIKMIYDNKIMNE